MNRLVYPGIVLILLVVSMATAQPPSSVIRSVEHHLPSREVAGMTYKLLITLPGDYERDNRPYPVLFYLDGWMLGGVMHDSHLIAGLLGAVEPVILVGLSLDGEASDFFYTRSRDYTPTKVAADNLGSRAAMVPTSGGGPAFLNFLKRELIPFIEGNYRVDAGDRGLLGYSLGGLFAAWVLQQEPALFKRYGICSPSLYWDDGLVVRLWENLPDLAAETVILFSQTEHEDQKVKSAIDTLVAVASSKPGVHVKRFEVANETHHTGVVATHMRALLLLYQKPQP